MNKIILDESKAILKESILDDMITQAVNAIPVDNIGIDTHTEEEKHTGVYSLLIDAIKEKWLEIDRYNSYVVTVKDVDPANNEILELLNTILTDEMTHIGLLQKAIENFDKPTADAIAEVEEENTEI